MISSVTSFAVRAGPELDKPDELTSGAGFYANASGGGFFDEVGAAGIFKLYFP